VLAGSLVVILIGMTFAVDPYGRLMHWISTVSAVSN
jgi:hypothetical protein